MTDKSTDAARRLALLGILLQTLHVLFGVTAIIGVLVTQMNVTATHGTVYHSQLKWQFTTFWIGLAGYAATFYLWLNHQIVWGVVVIFLVIVYRLCVSAWHWKNATPINFS